MAVNKLQIKKTQIKIEYKKKNYEVVLLSEIDYLPKVTTQRPRRMVLFVEGRVVTETDTTWFWANNSLISFHHCDGAPQISAGSESVWLDRPVIHLRQTKKLMKILVTCFTKFENQLVKSFQIHRSD